MEHWSAQFLPEEVRGEACVLARSVVEGACKRHVKHEGLKLLLRRAVESFGVADVTAPEQPARLREPTFALLVDVIARNFPVEAHPLVWPSVESAFLELVFSDEEPEPKYFTVVDVDQLPVPGLEVEVRYGNDALARRTTGDGGQVDLSDLPGHRFLISFPDGRAIGTRSGETRQRVPLRVEAGAPQRVRDARQARYQEKRYLEWDLPSRPESELFLGKTDDRGAETYDRVPDVYAGWVSALQHDLSCLGFHSGPCDGYYGLATVRAVAALQDESSRCTCETGVSWYTGPIDGRFGADTRSLLARWLGSGRKRHRRALSVEDMLDLVRRMVSALKLEEDPYKRMESNDDFGAIFGLGRFMQKRGDLGDLLQRMYMTDSREFEEIFGHRRGQLLLLQLGDDEPDVRMLSDVANAWRDKFERTASVPGFRLEQERLVRDRAMLPVLDLATEHRIFRARGIAMLTWANVVGGWAAAEVVGRTIGVTPVGREPGRHLAAVARRFRDEEVAESLPDGLGDDLVRLGAVEGIFDDCEELIWS